LSASGGDDEDGASQYDSLGPSPSVGVKKPAMTGLPLFPQGGFKGSSSGSSKKDSGSDVEDLGSAAPPPPPVGEAPAIGGTSATDISKVVLKKVEPAPKQEGASVGSGHKFAPVASGGAKSAAQAGGPMALGTFDPAAAKKGLRKVNAKQGAASASTSPKTPTIAVKLQPVPPKAPVEAVAAPLPGDVEGVFGVSLKPVSKVPVEAAAATEPGEEGSSHGGMEPLEVKKEDSKAGKSKVSKVVSSSSSDEDLGLSDDADAPGKVAAVAEPALVGEEVEVTEAAPDNDETQPLGKAAGFEDGDESPAPGLSGSMSSSNSSSSLGKAEVKDAVSGALPHQAETVVFPDVDEPLDDSEEDEEEEPEPSEKAASAEVEVAEAAAEHAPEGEEVEPADGGDA
jgi:hypothetical protein